MARVVEDVVIINDIEKIVKFLTEEEKAKKKVHPEPKILNEVYQALINEIKAKPEMGWIIQNICLQHDQGLNFSRAYQDYKQEKQKVQILDTCEVRRREHIEPTIKFLMEDLERRRPNHPDPERLGRIYQNLINSLYLNWNYVYTTQGGRVDHYFPGNFTGLALVEYHEELDRLAAQPAGANAVRRHLRP